MSVGTQTNFVSVPGATSVKVTNLAVPSADTQVAHALTSDLKQLMVRSREGATLQYCWANGETDTNFITISKNAVLDINDLSFTGKVLYLQSDTPGVVVEIQELY